MSLTSVIAGKIGRPIVGEGMGIQMTRTPKIMLESIIGRKRSALPSPSKNNFRKY